MTWDGAGLTLGLLIDDGGAHISMIDSVDKKICVVGEGGLDALIKDLTAKLNKRLPHKG